MYSILLYDCILLALCMSPIPKTDESLDIILCRVEWKERREEEVKDRVTFCWLR